MCRSLLTCKDKDIILLLFVNLQVKAITWHRDTTVKRSEALYYRESLHQPVLCTPSLCTQRHCALKYNLKFRCRRKIKWSVVLQGGSVLDRSCVYLLSVVYSPDWQTDRQGRLGGVTGRPRGPRLPWRGVPPRRGRDTLVFAPPFSSLFLPPEARGYWWLPPACRWPWSREWVLRSDLNWVRKVSW